MLPTPDRVAACEVTHVLAACVMHGIRDSDVYHMVPIRTDPYLSVHISINHLVCVCVCHL